MSEIKQVPAIGYSITANLGGDRQIVFQHFVGADESDADVNKTIDRLMALIDRQRALIELPDLKAARDKHRSHLSQMTADATKVEADFQAAQASLDIEAEELAKASDEAFNTGYAQHTASGRQGAYKPAGETKSKIDRAKQGAAQAQATKAKNEAEKQQALQNMAITIQRLNDEISILDGKIADAEKVT